MKRYDRNYLKILELNIYNSNKEEFYALILHLARTKQLAIVVTPNVDHYVRISKSDIIRSLYSKSDFCINDSRIMSLLVKIFFGKNISVITGSDLTSMILNRGSVLNLRILIVGADRFRVMNLVDNYNLDKCNVSHICPSFGFIENTDEVNYVCDFIVKERADIVFLALGSPQQELLAHIIKPKLLNGVILCVGASIDYLTGKEKRAPRFIQNMYLEWLFRFAQSPLKRFRRYFINCPQIIYFLLRERLLPKKL